MTERYVNDPTAKPSKVYQPLPGYLPDSTPLLPDHLAGTFIPETLSDKEVVAAHLALDALGVPYTREVDVTFEDDSEPRFATHDLRLHGRITFLVQRLAELGITDPFQET